MIRKLYSYFAGCALTVAMAAGLSSSPNSASAQASDPYIGQIMIIGFGFCPRGWAQANGALLPISQNTALFSLLGTTFGGDGRTTFGLPDLRGRSVVGGGFGAGPGLANVAWGERGGAQTHTLSMTELASHNHTMNATNNVADQRRPNGDILGFPDVMIDGIPLGIYNNGDPDVVMHLDSIGNTGNNQAFNIRDPYLGMFVCISLSGIFPSRN